MRKFINRSRLTGVYVYPCDKCGKWGMLLHRESCLNCKHKNHYFDSLHASQLETSVKNPAERDLKKILGVAEMEEFDVV